MPVRRSRVRLVDLLALLSFLPLSAMTGCAETEPARPGVFAAPQTVVVAYPAAAILSPAAPTKPIYPPPAPPGLADGNYVLRNVASQECLDVPHRSLVSPTLLWQWDCNGTDAQSWALHRVADDTFEVRSVVSGKCLDVPHEDRTNNITLWQFECNHTDAQRWTFNLGADGSYTLMSHASGLCLDVPHGTAERGLGVQQFTCHGGPPQRWVLARA